MTDRPDDSDANGTGHRQERTVQFSVPGMDCPSCAKTIDGRLHRFDGIGETAFSVVGNMGTSRGVTGNAMRLARIEPEPSTDGSAAVRERA